MATKSTPINPFSDDVDPVALPSDLFADTGNFFFDEDEKTAHIEQGTRFYITAVDFDDEGQFGARFVVSLVPADLDNASVKGWSFTATNEGRNQSMRALMDLLTANGGTRIGPVVVVQKGRFRTIAAA